MALLRPGRDGRRGTRRAARANRRVELRRSRRGEDRGPKGDRPLPFAPGQRRAGPGTGSMTPRRSTRPRPWPKGGLGPCDRPVHRRSRRQARQGSHDSASHGRDPVPAVRHQLSGPRSSKSANRSPRTAWSADRARSSAARDLLTRAAPRLGQAGAGRTPARRSRSTGPARRSSERSRTARLPPCDSPTRSTGRPWRSRAARLGQDDDRGGDDRRDDPRRPQGGDHRPGPQGHRQPPRGGLRRGRQARGSRCRPSSGRRGSAKAHRGGRATAGEPTKSELRSRPGARSSRPARHGSGRAT